MTDNGKYAEFSTAELNKKLAEMHDSLFRLRMKNSSPQLENFASIRKARREIATIETFLRQKACKC